MGWLDALLADLDGKVAPVAKVVTPAQPEPEIKTVWFQTRAPRDDDLGAVEAGFYSVADDVVTMHDENGMQIGKPRRLAAGEDARQIAGRIAKEAWAKTRGTDFNRPLGYVRQGYA